MHLTVDEPLKQEVYFLTFRKHLSKLKKPQTKHVSLFLGNATEGDNRMVLGPLLFSIYQRSIQHTKQQAAEVICSGKKNRPAHPVVFFTNYLVVSISSQKPFGLNLHTRLNFHKYFNEKIYKANKGIGLIKRLYYNLLRKPLLSIYKSFIIDYVDLTYDHHENK